MEIRGVSPSSSTGSISSFELWAQVSGSSVEGMEYQFQKGQTWSDFVTSAYSNSDFECQNDVVVFEMSLIVVYGLSNGSGPDYNNSVKPSDEIIPNATYYAIIVV